MDEGLQADIEWLRNLENLCFEPEDYASIENVCDASAFNAKLLDELIEFYQHYAPKSCNTTKNIERYRKISLQVVTKYPEPLFDHIAISKESSAFIDGWNKCIEKFEQLNKPSTTGAGE